MIVDLAIEPECQRYGYKCEYCGEVIPFPQTQCPGCSEEVAWLDRDGHKRANYPPRTAVMKYAFSILGIKYFRTEAERETWEALEKETGEEPIAAWVNWLREKAKGRRRLGHKGLRGLYTCVTQYGMPRGGTDGKLRTGSRKSEHDADAVPAIQAQDKWLERLGKDFT